MASINYPEYFPQNVIMEQLQFQEGESLLMTQMDSGHREYISIFPDVPDYFQCEMLMTGEQSKSFRYWHANILNNGMELFNFKIPDEFDDMKTSECRIPEKPIYNQISDAPKQYRVTFTLEVRNPRYETEMEYNRKVNPQIFPDFSASDFDKDDFFTTVTP